MAYSERLAERIAQAFGNIEQVEQKKMFGGVAFMVGGHMCCGVVGDELMVRVGPNAYERLLKREHAREMDFTGRALKGMLYIGADGIRTKTQLQYWIAAGLEFVQSLPAKTAKTGVRRKK